MNYLEMNNIYNFDCFEFLDKVKNNSIDLAIIDPPYNMKKAEWDSFASQDEFMNFTKKWLSKVIKKLKTNGSLYIFNTPYNCAYILVYLVKCKLIFQNWITWDKRDGLSGTTKKYTNGQETILFFTKSNNYTFNYNDIRIPYESKNRIEAAKKIGILKNGKRWFPNENGRLCGEVWHIASERHRNKINGKIQKQNHPTIKPLELIERIVKASSNRNDLILDCFVGSGTTAVAAKKLNRNFICSDINKEYVDLAKQNLGKINDLLE